jgi:molybdopterin-guanine dinucleotide biosynthesis protein A
VNSTNRNVVAGVLVGGHSARMGTEKSLLLARPGVTFLEHVVAVARQVAGEVVLLGGAAEIRTLAPDLLRLPDATPAAGPAAGLAPLLEYAGDRWALLLACDLPRLDPATLQSLLAAATAEFNAVAFREAAQGGRFHACCALYHPRLLSAVRAALAAGRPALQGLLAAARVPELFPNEEQARALTNVNTPQDYERLQAE